METVFVCMVRLIGSAISSMLSYQIGVSQVSIRKSYNKLSIGTKSVTLNDLEQRNCRYNALFHRIP